MKKIFTLIAALLASISLSWAETVTFTSAEIKAGTAKSGITPYFDANPTSKNLCKDGDTQNKANVCEVKSSSDTILVNSLKSQAQVLFTANGKYITKIVVNGATNSTGSGAVKNIPALYWKGTTRTDEFDGAELVTFSGYDASCENAYYTFENMPAKTQMAGIFRRVKVDNASNPTKKVNKSGKDYGDGQTFYVAEVEVTFENACADPNASLSADPSSAFVGDEVELLFSSDIAGDPNWSVKKDGVAAEAGVDYTLADARFHGLVAGEFEITATQDADDTHCAVEESVSITVSPKNPVTTVTVNGPASGFIGAELTYTATAAGATQYAWFVDDVNANTNAASFTYTAVKGEHSIVCKARNEFNEAEEWIASEAKTVTVTKLCGELIKVAQNGQNAGTITAGVFDATADVKLSSGTTTYNDQTGRKIGSNNYYLGLTLKDDATFQAGDVVTIFLTPNNEDPTIPGCTLLQLFSDKGETLIGEKTSDFVIGENTITLTNAANGKNALYLYRTSTAGSAMNPFVAYISVTRPCEESNDANIYSLTVNSDAVEENNGLFEYTVSSSYEEPTVTIAFEIHPLATIKYGLSNPYELTTPEAGSSRGQAFTIIAEDGTEKTYTVQVYKSASLSDNANLSALSVKDLTLTPAFDADVTEYTATKAWSKILTIEEVTATPADANAKGVVVELSENVFTITVTAEDNTTTKVYTITVNTADAKKDLLEALFSNGAKGFINAGVITVPYLAGEEEPTFVSAKFWEAEGEPTAESVEGKLVVTGADSKQAEYTITFQELTPMELSYDEVTFTEVPSYIAAPYGWDADKGVKFAKNVEEANNHRISLGNNRIYIALPAAGKVVLTSGSAGARDVKITVNGNICSVTKTAVKDAAIEVAMNPTRANFVAIESNQTGGDTGFTKLQLGPDYPTGMDNTNDAVKAVKMIENGQIVIIKNGVRYNVLGAVLK